MKQKNKSKLILKDGTIYEGKSFGAPKSISGEVVFATGMVGYPEALTDPSFKGQILVMTYPLVGNYGVPDKSKWESDKIQVSGLIVSSYIDTPSHHDMKMTLGEWLKKEGVPALEIKDTRGITIKLRESGVMLGAIVNNNKKVKLEDPNLRNLTAEVSVKKITYHSDFGNFSPLRPSLGASGTKRDPRGLEIPKVIVVIDCGEKRNMVRRLIARGVKVIVVPWDTDVTKLNFKFDGVLISNGPGDPKMATATIENMKKIIAQKIPTLGICLGNQILALAAGGTTYKLKFGHRSQNQPVVMEGTKQAYLTTQNHGFAVGEIPPGFKVWFTNANDSTNEGIIHESLPFMSVQFHPEASPGPIDTDFIFDEFIKKLS
jgi:carbamoyl-phosphate synthase small subunit